MLMISDHEPFLAQSTVLVAYSSKSYGEVVTSRRNLYTFKFFRVLHILVAQTLGSVMLTCKDQDLCVV